MIMVMMKTKQETETFRKHPFLMSLQKSGTNSAAEPSPPSKLCICMHDRNCSTYPYSPEFTANSCSFTWGRAPLMIIIIIIVYYLYFLYIYTFSKLVSVYVLSIHGTWSENGTKFLSANTREKHIWYDGNWLFSELTCLSVVRF